MGNAQKMLDIGVPSSRGVQRLRLELQLGERRRDLTQRRSLEFEIPEECKHLSRSDLWQGGQWKRNYTRKPGYWEGHKQGFHVTTDVSLAEWRD